MGKLWWEEEDGVARFGRYNEDGVLQSVVLYDGIYQAYGSQQDFLNKKPTITRIKEIHPLSYELISLEEYLDFVLVTVKKKWKPPVISHSLPF